MAAIKENKENKENKAIKVTKVIKETKATKVDREMKTKILIQTLQKSQIITMNV